MIPVRDVKKAFRILLEEKVDCILIDAGFPLFQVTQFIENVETSDQIPCIPILIVSSDDRLDEAELMIRNGAFDIIRYPFQPVEVVVRLHTVISHIKDHSPYQPPAKVVHPRGWQTKS
jgi:DNA-binding response OmpR family regulator